MFRRPLHIGGIGHQRGESYFPYPKRVACPPSELWGALDMLKFSAALQISLSQALSQISEVSQLMAAQDVPFGDRDAFINLLKTVLKPELERYGLELSLLQCSRLIKAFEEGAEPGSIQSMVEDLRSRTFDELDNGYFLHLTNEESKLFEPAIPHFGIDVQTKFPSATYDIEEAGKCAALGRSTASAFHSIRCLEAAIRAICRCLGIPDPTKGSDRTWSAILHKVTEEMDKRWPKSGRLSGDGEFFEKVVGALAALQNPYRNATMHLDEKYTEAEAKHILGMVGGLMRIVASRMDEQGLPLA